MIAAADVRVQVVAAPLWQAVHRQARRVRLDFHTIDPAILTDPLSAMRTADFVSCPHSRANPPTAAAMVRIVPFGVTAVLSRRQEPATNPGSSGWVRAKGQIVPDGARACRVVPFGAA